jgi:hypothetical protein
VSPIIDLQRRLVEVGRIRMGKKGDKGQPQKLDTWRLTSNDQARLAAAADLFGGAVTPWDGSPKGDEHELITATAELPILLLPGQALSQWHELWSGGGCQRRCDGEREILSDSPCLCDTEGGDRKCKPTTRLSVMLPDVPGLGCWRLESHGYYAAVELSATAAMLEQATARGQMLPARLRIDQRRQLKDGKTTRYAVPVIDIDVRFREAVAGIEGHRVEVLEPAPEYKALPASTGVSVRDGLDAAARQAEPRATTARSAAPIGPAADFTQPGPVPVPDDDGTIVVSEPEKRTAAQTKKLNVLVGKLRDGGAITTEQLYAALSRARQVEPETMVDLLAGRDQEGVLHWSPLRDSLSKAEASDLIDRLSKLEANVAAAA